MSALVNVLNVEKAYPMGAVTFQALKGVSLSIESGEFLAIMGPSGSGKSTLLHLIGGLDRPTQGTLEVSGAFLNTMNETALAKFRRKHIGFVFQFFNLIDNLSIQANIELPALLISRADHKAVRRRAGELMKRLGIRDQATKHPWELSGGQQQRVAIARALINTPTLLLADEPTGNLDSQSGHEVLNTLREFNAQGQTILMVTHDVAAASAAQAVLFIKDGILVERMAGSNASQIAQSMARLTGT
ncbi:MAG: ABC transporter ATP-binding protein [Anaerolineae bacterium]|nr:ABC transporter ATP-binding protein [Anaerolineae bacterium]